MRWLGIAEASCGQVSANDSEGTWLSVPLRSALGQGRLWQAGGWHSRSTPAPEIPRAFQLLRFVLEANIRQYGGEVY